MKKSPNEIEKALLAYRNTSKGNLGSPNQRLFRRQTRSSLPTTNKQLQPKIIENMEENLKKERERQKFYFDKHTIQRKVPDESDLVMVQHPTIKTWQPAKVMQKHSDRSLLVQLED